MQNVLTCECDCPFETIQTNTIIAFHLHRKYQNTLTCLVTYLIWNIVCTKFNCIQCLLPQLQKYICQLAFLPIPPLLDNDYPITSDVKSTFHYFVITGSRGLLPVIYTHHGKQNPSVGQLSCASVVNLHVSGHMPLRKLLRLRKNESKRILQGDSRKEKKSCVVFDRCQ